MNDVVAALESLGVIRWLDDIQTVATSNAAVVTACAALLRSVVRPASPRAVAEAIVEDVRRRVGERVDQTTAAALQASVQELLVHDLWRCQGTEQVLAERIVHAIERVARVRFDDS